MRQEIRVGFGERGGLEAFLQMSGPHEKATFRGREGNPSDFLIPFFA